MEKMGFDAPYFTDDKEARLYLERVRWPNGPPVHIVGVKRSTMY
jgi:hypothetical protein